MKKPTEIQQRTLPECFSSGACKVYFAKVLDNRLKFVFDKIMDIIPEGTPVICESPALRNFVEPGVFIIMTSDTINKHKNISHLQALPHVMFKLEELNSINTIPIGFERWQMVFAGPCTPKGGSFQYLCRDSVRDPKW